MEIYYKWSRSKILSLLNPPLSFVLVQGVSCNSGRQTASTPPHHLHLLLHSISSCTTVKWTPLPNLWLLLISQLSLRPAQTLLCSSAQPWMHLHEDTPFTIPCVSAMLAICVCSWKQSVDAVYVGVGLPCYIFLHSVPQSSSEISVRKHALLSSVCYIHTSPHTGIHAQRRSSSLPFICVWLWRGGFKWARMIMSMGALKRKIGCVCNTHKHTHTLTTLTHPCPLWNRPTKLGCLS